MSPDCPHCGKAYTYKTSLKNHIKLEHGDSKPLKTVPIIEVPPKDQQTVEEVGIDTPEGQKALELIATPPEDKPKEGFGVFGFGLRDNKVSELYDELQEVGEANEEKFDLGEEFQIAFSTEFLIMINESINGLFGKDYFRISLKQKKVMDKIFNAVGFKVKNPLYALGMMLLIIYLPPTLMMLNDIGVFDGWKKRIKEGKEKNEKEEVEKE